MIIKKMKKKNYMKPYIKVCQLHAPAILAGSPAAKQANQQYEEVDTNNTIDWN